MRVLFIKLGATGDVVRTTPLLTRLRGDVTWVTAAKNKPLLIGLPQEVRCLSWEGRQAATDRKYDLVINLEDDIETSAFLKEISFTRLFGAYLTPDNELRYTDDAQRWFDLSLISKYGREEAD